MIASVFQQKTWGALVLLVAGAWFATAGAAHAQLAPAAAQAARKPAVEVVLVQSKVVTDAKGKEQLVAADSVRPGDVLLYQATYTNNTGRAVKGLVAELPIPEGLEYQPQSAKPGGKPVTVATASAAKGGQFAAEPLSRLVNGKAQPVPYNEYRALRWTLGELPANGSAVVSARARVESVAPPTASNASGVSARPNGG